MSRELSSCPPNHLDLASTYGAILASTEVGLGSLLHAFHVPLTGQFLSLNQGFLLSYAMVTAQRTANTSLLPAGISVIAASLKSLSPAGKKLTPMLAIAMQGWLYNLGILLGGNSLLGRALGAALSSLWAFIQPFLFLGVVFGLEWQKLYAAYASSLPVEQALMVIAAVVVAKAFAAMGLSFAALKIPHEGAEAYFARLNRYGLAPSSPPVGQQRFFSSLRRPLFLLPFLVTIIVAAFMESHWVPILWTAFRPLAIACLLFVVVRLLAVSGFGIKLATWLPGGYGEALKRVWKGF